MASYGTNPKAPLVENDIERMQAYRVQSSLSELVAEVKFGRSLMLSALFVTILMCFSTFTMVVLATRYSAETTIVGGVMTEKSTNQVVATAEHQAVIASPLTLSGSQGVKRITISRNDGTLISHKVEAASRVSCKKASGAQQMYCNEDGFSYLFDTARGVYVGTQGANGVKFQLVDEISADSLRVLGAMRPKMSMASGKAL